MKCNNGGGQVVPNCASRSALGETCDGGLLEIFSRDFGPPGSAAFERARHNFLRSEAGSAPDLAALAATRPAACAAWSGTPRHSCMVPLGWIPAPPIPELTISACLD